MSSLSSSISEIRKVPGGGGGVFAEFDRFNRVFLSSDWPTQSSESGSDSSDAYSPQESRTKPVPRATARVPGQTRRTNNDKGSKRGFKDSDDERNRIPSRKATGNVWLVSRRRELPVLKR